MSSGLGGSSSFTVPQDSTTPSSSSAGVFNPGNIVGTAVGGSGSTYDNFGLPTGLGEQQIYVGYLPPNDSRAPAGAGHSTDTPDPGRSQTLNQEVTVKDLIQHFHDMATSTNAYTRQAWAQTQSQLQAFDAYGGSTRINYGGWNANDVNALQSAIQGYLAGGQQTMQTFEDYVKQQSAQGAANGLDGNQPGGPGAPGAGSASSGPQFKATSPQDIMAAGDTRSEQMLGQALPTDQQGALVSAVQGQQRDAFNQGDVYSRSVTPDAVARQFIVNNNLQQYTGHQAEGYVNAFANLFLSGASSRANTSVGDVAVGTK